MGDGAANFDIEESLAKVGVIPALQARSRTLRDRLIQEALAIARQVPFDDVSINEICAAADCSTGAFYSRFPDKITLFKAVMVFAAAESGPLLQDIVRFAPFDQILTKLMARQVERYQLQETFFRSAFKVSLDSPEAWEPFRRNANRLAEAFLERLRSQPEFDQDRVNPDRVRFAFQVMYGVLNNAIINRPGPFLIESEDFPVLLEEAMLSTMLLPRREP
ncbi:TetR/AcrR family transcriptional regulator [Novosphingobium pentaromativorans]|uniref:TetR family transcriptional regulator n=1 Tax=Novosphingobium pentaromativorans US6-1 TaxID=1088721 RepID=G6EFW1_9SPHN|nr:TetR/AcrR family transcriptional regulator [Novosphingobium pentaromativorans]AIT81782.1 TetR family transcriptional regulator [Novosphingobium pentaromativorans US6-1]EHJ59650.1 TetR family transcriptional regulator [Novosphingobium pentaromativorans US6-1]